MTACHAIQRSHCKLSEMLEGGMKSLEFVGSKGTEMIITSPVSNSSTCNIHCHYVVVLLWDPGAICIGNTSKDVPKTIFKSKLKLIFSVL